MRNIRLVLAVALFAATVTYAQTGDLVAAAKRGDLAAVNALLKAGADVNERKLMSFGPAGVADGTALMAASSSGHLEVVQALLAAKADVNATISYGGSERKDRETALALAVHQGHIEVVRTLLAAQADVNAPYFGANAIYDAALLGNIDMVRVLLTAKPDLNVANTANDKTPLTMALGAGRFDIAGLLIDAGANVNRWNRQGLTPLLLVANGDGSKNLEMMQSLLAAHADPNFRECQHSFMTALGLVSARGNVEAVQSLLAAGADAKQPQCDGTTPLELAVRNNNQDVAELLKNALATK